MEHILSFFDEIVRLYAAHPVAQSIGFVAMTISFIAFQARTPRGIVLWQAAANALWFLHFLLLGAWIGSLMNLATFPRNLIYGAQDKHAWARSLWWPHLFTLCYVVMGVSCYLAGEGPIILLAIAGQSFSNYAMRWQRVQHVRLGSAVTSAGWWFYNLLSGSIAGVICETFNQISLHTALLRTHFAKSRNED